MKKLYISFLFTLIFSSIYAQFDYVVDAAGSGTNLTIQSAIDDCPTGVRKYIFVKNGTYREKVLIGNATTASSKLISLIGESAEGVLIVWDDYNGKSILYNGKTVVSGTPQSATFTVNASDFYAENLTIQNEYLDAQAVALCNFGDRQTFKNCRLLGFQDTHYLKKARRYYFLNCYIEGGTDFVCAGGTSIFESCTIKSLKNGSYISAPEDITYYDVVGAIKYYHGFVFRNCELTSDDGIEVYLGRPWQATSSSVYINCKMKNIKPQGWSVWSSTNHETSFFAEYNSVDYSNNPIDITNRVAWSYQLNKDEVDAHYTNEKIYSHIATAYNPVALTTSLSSPVNMQFATGVLSWDAVGSAMGYVIIKNGRVSGFSTTNSYSDVSALNGDTFVVKSVSDIGNLSAASSEIVVVNTAIGDHQQDLLMTQEGRKLMFNAPVNIDIINLSGIQVKTVYDRSSLLLTDLKSGIYMVKYSDLNSGRVNVSRIVLK